MENVLANYKGALKANNVRIEIVSQQCQQPIVQLLFVWWDLNVFLENASQFQDFARMDQTVKTMKFVCRINVLINAHQCDVVVVIV